jgi:uncharacterized damage-inducible protein DinB
LFSWLRIFRIEFFQPLRCSVLQSRARPLSSLIGRIFACQRKFIVYDKPLIIEQNLTLLAATPSRLTEITKGLTATQLLMSPEPGEWSARDVLAHLRACSDMWGTYIKVILSEDHPTYRAMNPTTWIKQTNYLEQKFRPSLQAFTAQRRELLAVLTKLPPQAWERAATVTGAGKPRERTVRTYAMWLANHEGSHFRQIEHIAQALRG